MPSPAGPFHAAQQAAVRDSTALAAAMGTAGKGILNEPAPNQVPPYVVLGENQINLDTSSDCGDEAEITSTIHLWSRTSPLDKGAQARAMGSALIDALNTDLTISGWDVVDWELQSESYSTDPDQSTHGVLIFHYLLTEQAT